MKILILDNKKKKQSTNYMLYTFLLKTFQKWYNYKIGAILDK